MADWRIRKCYGRGAARVVLCPTPYRAPACEPSLIAGLTEIGPQLLGGAKTGVVFGAVIITAFFFTAMRDRTDLTLTQITFWRSPTPAEEVKPPPAVVPPAAAIPKPPDPVVAKVEVKPAVKPKSEPVPVVVAVKPKAKPKPKPVPKARRPKIEMAALQSPKVPEASRQTRKRVETKQPERRKLVPTLALAANAPVPVDRAQPRSARTQRVSHLDVSRSKMVPALAVAPSRALLSEPAPDRAVRRRSPGFKLVQDSGTSRSGIAPAGIAAATSQQATDPGTATRSASRRSSVVASSSRSSRRVSVDIGLAPAALAPGASGPVPEPTRRIAREVAATAPELSSQQQTSLRGVSLGSLASCVSDREEDLLKQRVLAAVRNRKACTSANGSYRFVETKNLNAFSMWIERAPGRRASDRCVELTHALACLE